ncbi:hypothetical protein J2Z40_001158 [Cytobacillus eiseniae]|uniref:Polymer-forming cytoskeletal protein n=1 Tax=Cytobacillus eiseniae TaxID=762947 RepID=A0ABS4RCI1_9BACI|nr:hypothetical protein [Cytobacillus eiseniae]MBP2240601.1 hypothetical protein [Cytobacillus eiseniae]
MIHNDRGNTLITVLLASLIFAVLGMAIVASSLSGAKKTETRESDVLITYDSIKLVDQMTSDLALLLNGILLEDYRTGFNNNLRVSSSFDSDLYNELIEILIKPNREQKLTLSCINIIDLSNDNPSYIDGSDECAGSLTDYDHYNIEKDKDFTRVFDIVLVTNNPSKIEGKISRTITKRIILSPLPSFLKYAAGSDDELILNGSPNFYGNVFAKSLSIDKNAKYYSKNGNLLLNDTPLPSINGDLYSQYATIIDILEGENFYKESVPKLKHDSQFVNIEFNKTMNENTNIVLTNSGLRTERYDSNSAFSQDLAAEIGGLKSPTGTINNCKEDDEENEDEENEDHEKNRSSNTVVEGNCIKSDKNSVNLGSIEIQGDLVVTSTIYPVSFYDLSVDGDLYLESNADISVDGNVIIEGDLYIVGNQNVNITGNVYVSGKTHLLNYGGKLQIENNLISADSITAESHVENKNKLDSHGLKLKGDIISGKDFTIKPLNSSIEIDKNIFTNYDFKIEGNEFDNNGEDDEVIFDSVVYVGNKAEISNVNILGADNNKKQLILLANNDLLITRINEFNNFDSLEEKGHPYIPIEDNKITPLKGFFYTEQDAELYGVGSLFYIEGGLFAKGKLTINAIRGEVDSIDKLPSSSFQEDKFSRFIVNYDQDVMLKQIDALPIVEHLQIFSDELLVK